MRHKKQNNVNGRCIAWESNGCSGKILIICLLIGVLILTSLAGAGEAATSLSNSGGGSWQYYRDINITEKSGNTLTDYQVLVQLEGSSFPATRSDGADIRFMDVYGNELSYWSESWDYAGKIASIWVKVPNIPANGNTNIKMYYGNTNASSINSGAKTFEFFDDFNILTGWGTYGNATRYRVLTLEGRSVVTIEGWGEIVMPLLLKLSNYAFESMSKLTSGIEAYMPFLGFGQSDRTGDEDNAYQFGYNVLLYDPTTPTYLDNIRIIQNKALVKGKNGDSAHKTRTGWAKTEFTVFNGTLTQKVYDSSKGMQNITLTDTGYWTGQIPKEIGIIVWNGATYAVDWIVIRKLVTPEPALVLGAEHPTSGNILITSKPSGAEVFVDGVSKGKANQTINISNISPGPHKLKCNLSGYSDNNTIITVVGGEVKHITCTLNKIIIRPPWLIIAAVAILILASLALYLWTRNNLQLIPERTSISCDGKSTLPIKVQFSNTFGKIRKQNKDREVEMKTTSGKIQNVIIPAGKEFIEATLTSSNECGQVTVTARSGKQRSEVQLDFVCKEAGLDVSISPAEIPADGKSTATVTLKIKDDQGNFITSLNERTVELTTNLGNITSPVKISPKTPTGTATITSGDKSGTAIVTASIGPLKGEGKVAFAELPRRYCEHCGAAIGTEAQKCPKCGKIPISDIDTKECNNCREVIPLSAKFCKKCGARQPS